METLAQGSERCCVEVCSPVDLCLLVPPGLEQLQTLINTAGCSVTVDRSIVLGWIHAAMFIDALDISQVTKEWEARMQYVRSSTHKRIQLH